MLTTDITRQHWRWDQTRTLHGGELQQWVNLMRQLEAQTSHNVLNHMQAHEVHGHVCIPLSGIEPSPLIAIAREIHCQGYSSYFPNGQQHRDMAKRSILSADTDSTQTPGVWGDAWMCYTKDHPVTREDDIYGLMYEIQPKRVHLYGCPLSKHRGWRTLPVGKLYSPADIPSPLSSEGLRLLDELELSGAQFSELSGLSVRPTAADAGLVFHEIMRRIVHRDIIAAADGGLKRVLAFAIVEKTRNSIRTRMGRDNFVPLGDSFPPPGKDVDKNTLLAPSIIEPKHFLDRMVSSYRDAQRAGRPLKVLVEGIRFYTRGLAWRYLSLSPTMIDLLEELDQTAPSEEPRNAVNGWHDQCGETSSCTVCNAPRLRVVRLADILYAERVNPRTVAA